MEREPKIVRMLFNDDMARAIVSGRKTMTRRPVMPFRIGDGVDVARIDGRTAYLGNDDDGDIFVMPLPCAPGDILIGREACVIFDLPMTMGHVLVEYRADRHRVEHRGSAAVGGGVAIDFGSSLSRYATNEWRVRPAVQMPDAVARIRRRVVSVTVERVQDITEEDAVREGFEAVPVHGKWVTGGRETHWSARKPFAETWDSIYAAKGLGWHANPFVCRIEFSAENAPAA